MHIRLPEPSPFGQPLDQLLNPAHRKLPAALRAEYEVRRGRSFALELSQSAKFDSPQRMIATFLRWTWKIPC